QPSFHLLKMVRPEFVVEMRTAVARARKTGAAVHSDRLYFDYEGKTSAVEIDVRPLAKRNGKSQDLLVVFRRIEVAPRDTAGPAGRHRANSSHLAEKAASYERELAATREHLRSLIAEHETAQEEMKAANEEILSSNEELQSTNEELETAKEELQSSNEELITLNEELQNRNLELSQVNNDLLNLLSSINIPVVMLSPDLRIRRFTPQAEKALNLI